MENEDSASAKSKKVQIRGTEKKTKQGQTKSGDSPSLNMSEIRELAELVDQYGYTDFEFENENIRVRMSKNSMPQYAQFLSQMPPSSPASTNASVPTSITPPETVETIKETEKEVDSDLHKITSPIVGTFYRAPAPDKDPYVKEGSKVNFDTIVCIVEAMKLMNEIPAEVTGEIVKIYVENGQPVEFGQPLFGIKQ